MSILKAALLGKDVSYSLSPDVHRAIFEIAAKRYNMDYHEIQYSLHSLDEYCDVGDWVKRAKSEGYIGANVTSPYKSEVHSLADFHVGVSAALDSGNTLSFGENATALLSTDGIGLVSSLLREHHEFSLEHYHLVSLGAGDAAKSVLYSLCTKWMPRSLTIVNRSRAAAEELAEFCIAQAPGPSVRVLGINEFMQDSTETMYRLLLQSTPIGSAAHPGNIAAGFTWHETDFAIDLTYNPEETTFLRSAKAAGVKTLSGLGMLIEQAVFAQVYWMTGVLPDRSPLTDEEYYHIKESMRKHAA